MRIAYLDEAGVGDPQNEPHLVVAGVILNGDQDWRSIQRHLDSILRRHVPEDRRGGLIFHATDIWGGTKKFHKSVFPEEKRRVIFMEIAEIPRKFHLTVVVGLSDLAHVAADILKRIPSADQRQVDHLTHVQTYMKTLAEIDTWMGKNVPSENAMVIAEDRPGVKETLKMVHFGATHDEETFWSEWGEDVFSTRNVIDTVHLSGKEGSPMLQIADMCAFIIRRYLHGKNGVEEAFDLLRPQFATPPRQGYWRLPSEPMPRHFRLVVPRGSVEIVTDLAEPERSKKSRKNSRRG